MSLEKDYLKDLFTDEVKGCLKSDGDPVGTAANAVSEHNTSENAHNDIRLSVAGLISRLNALADSDDETLDQVSELVAYIKANRELIDSITTGKVSVSDIINNLTTNISNKPLSAAQGVALKALIDAINVPTKVSELQNDAGYLTQHQDISGKADASDLTAHARNSTVHVTAEERTKWNAKSNFSGSYNDLSDKPTIPTVPTKVSELQNDAGYLTQHQDISDLRAHTENGTVHITAEERTKWNQAVTDVGNLSEEIDNYLPKFVGTDKVGKIAIVGTDGYITWIDMPEGSSGDVIGTLDEANNILLTGNLADGTYTLKYENEDGTYTEIGTLEVGAIPEPEPSTYSITNTLANCTTSNDAKTIDHGANYSATISKDDAFAGHTAIYVTMGGVDISTEAVSGDNINIENVTGDIIISCVAYKANVRYSLSSFAETTNGASGLELTGYIPCKYGDTVYMKDVTVNADSKVQTMIWTDSNFEKISISTAAASGTYTGSVFGDVTGEVKSCILNYSTVGSDTFSPNVGIAYIRFTAKEINANSIITVNQPIK